jgi:hypothetical protein
MLTVIAVVAVFDVLTRLLLPMAQEALRATCQIALKLVGCFYEQR